nr:accessory gene regulator B family protein [uncultured Acetatifactor sp.]
MENIKKQIKEKYHLSNYQIAQIVFVFKTFGSELSKMLIMGILFRNRLPQYFFALLIMLLLRCSTGGLHFYTYPGCLIGSAIYLGLSVFILPDITPPKYLQLLMLAGCILTCYLIGPVTSRYRPDPAPDYSRRFRNFTCLTIFFYALFSYIVPEGSLTSAGFWVIILHSLQLCAAKIQKKGGRAK